VVVQLRPSGATTMAAGVEVTDGWAHSPITRLGSENATAGIAITDGWAHSPITRGGSNSRAALLRQLAANYEAQGPAAEARSR
jgi:Mg-chelatase subunit ChlD